MHLNWQTERVLNRTVEELNDTGVFSEDQVAALQKAFRGIAEAMEAQAKCTPINHHI